MPDFEDLDQAGGKPPPEGGRGLRFEEAYQRTDPADFGEDRSSKPYDEWTPDEHAIARDQPEAYTQAHQGVLDALDTVDVADALFHESPDMRKHAAEVLGSRGDPEALPYLIAALHDRDDFAGMVVDEERWAMASVLGAIGRFGSGAEEAIPALIERLPATDFYGDDSPQIHAIRNETLDALANIGTDGARDALVDFLRTSGADGETSAVVASRGIAGVALVQQERLLDDLRANHVVLQRGPEGELQTHDDYVVIPKRNDTSPFQDTLEYIGAWYEHVVGKFLDQVRARRSRPGVLDID